MTTALMLTHAGPGVGGGHLSRMSALASGFEYIGITVRWMLNDDARDMATSLGLHDISYVDAPFAVETAARAASSGADLIAVDTYTANADFYREIHDADDCKLVLIADAPGTPGEPFADFVIDYSLGAESKGYGTDHHSLLGGRYALIRRIFWDLEPSDGDHVVIIPGASDIASVCERIAEWARPTWPHIKMICGPLVPSDMEARARRAAHGKSNVEILRAPHDLPMMMAGARVVICTASVTMNEALSLHKPTAIFVVADNQRGAGEYLSERRCAYDLGAWSDVRPDDIERAFDFEPDREALNDLVDRRGALRCATEIKELLHDKSN